MHIPLFSKRKKEKEKRKEKVHIPYKTKNASTQHVCNPKRLDSSPIKKKKKALFIQPICSPLYLRERSQKGKNTTEILVFRSLGKRKNSSYRLEKIRDKKLPKK